MNTLVRRSAHRKTRCVFISIFASVVLGGCATHQSSSESPSEARAQLFGGLGPHRRPVSTRSAEAQAFFDQGLNWSYAFNHDEAIRSFTRAAELDPSLAAAWWGVALCNGPHINNTAMPEERSRAAWDALQKAQELKVNAAPVEQALIDALAARYTWPAPIDRTDLNQAYARAMAEVARRFPSDQDVQVLYAESLMDTQPWDLWTLDGQPKGSTLDILAALERVLAENPEHPGAAHFYIHACEAAKPHLAIKAADALRNLAPISGHLTHMPSHIDVRVGAFAAAAEANRQAIIADANYTARSPQQDFYRVYMQHNQQFLAFACMMLGRSEEAIDAAQAAVALPDEWVKANAGAIDGFLTVYMDTLKRFGRWNDILALQPPLQELPYCTAMWRLNRAVALAALGRIADAQAEQSQFESARAAVPEQAMAQINPARRVLELGAHVLNGELAYAKKDYPAAERHLRQAAAIEDTLQYMEPPDWMVPVRHTLGVVLLDADRPAEAEAVYTEDLRRWPMNGWSLLGLTHALERQGKSAEAAAARTQFDKAWANADIKPRASCLCAPVTP